MDDVFSKLHLQDTEKKRMYFQQCLQKPNICHAAPILPSCGAQREVIMTLKQPFFVQVLMPVSQYFIMVNDLCKCHNVDVFLNNPDYSVCAGACVFGAVSSRDITATCDKHHIHMQRSF